MHYQLAIIGGGTAAIAAICEALELGVQSIAYIERRREIGGECVLNGCVPLHTMLHGANLFHRVKEMEGFGLNTATLEFDFERLMQKVEATVYEDLSDPYAGDPRVTLLHGEASFISPGELRITGGSGEQVISADQILITVGARPVDPDIPGLKETGHWRYYDATHAKTLPKRLAVIGGGRLGIEFSQLFARLGSRVDLFEVHDRLMHREDEDSSDHVRKLLELDGVNLHLNTEIAHVSQSEQGKEIAFLDATRAMQTLQADEILVATGRKFRPEGLNLEAAGVQYDSERIITNERGQTTVKTIWAAGDAAGPIRFTHAADYQAVIAVQNLLKAKDTKLDYRTMPIAYFTEPPLARVGLTEAQARERFQSVIVLKKEIHCATRCRVEGEDFGFCKILVDADTDFVLGAHMMARHADDSIHLPALAMHGDITVPQLTAMVYAYPTHIQLVQKTLEPYRRIKAEARTMSLKTVYRVS